jgi:hypothetical protein
MDSWAKKLLKVARIVVNIHLCHNPRNNNKNLVYKQFKKCVTILKYRIYLLVLVEIISCCISVNRNTIGGFTRKERREMRRPKAGVLGITGSTRWFEEGRYRICFVEEVYKRNLRVKYRC